MIAITVHGTAFECGRSCGTILHTHDTAYIVPGEGQVICAECALKEQQEKAEKR